MDFVHTRGAEEHFLQTLEDIGISKFSLNWNRIVARLKQKTLALLGFPFAIQLLAYEVIPTLQKLEPTLDDEVFFSRKNIRNLAITKPITSEQIIDVEHETDLTVESIIRPTAHIEGKVLAWTGSGSGSDRLIENVEWYISENYEWNPQAWPSGDYSCKRVYNNEERAALEAHAAYLKSLGDKKVTLNEAEEVIQKREKLKKEMNCDDTRENDGGKLATKKFVLRTVKSTVNDRTEFFTGLLRGPQDAVAEPSNAEAVRLQKKKKWKEQREGDSQPEVVETHVVRPLKKKYTAKKAVILYEGRDSHDKETPSVRTGKKKKTAKRVVTHDEEEDLPKPTPRKEKQALWPRTTAYNLRWSKSKETTDEDILSSGEHLSSPRKKYFLLLSVHNNFRL